MGKKIGLDFGTTYSLIASLKDVETDKKGIITNYTIEGGEEQDSLAVMTPKGKMFYGLLARDRLSNPNNTVYKGFKMLIPEKDDVLLSLRGFTKEITPKTVSRDYLEYIIKNCLSNFRDGEQTIDKIVVGVPEIWFDGMATVDGRTFVHDTVKAIEGMDGAEVELVSEPAAACAFFVEKYRKNEGKQYKGRMLVIDYGGGTLDVSLCDIKTDGRKSDIKPLMRCGFGENQGNNVGMAGMAFLEEVVKLAISKKTKVDKDTISSGSISECVKMFETCLRQSMTNIRRHYDSSDITVDDDYVLRVNGAEFSFTYEDEDYEVTYGMMTEAFNNIALRPLEDSIAEVKKYMDSKKMSYKNTDDFQVVLVGGFCNFYLTEKKVKDLFNFEAAGDRHFALCGNRGECEKAVAYGAALIANDIIRFVNVTPYELKMVGYKIENGERKPNYDISFKVFDLNEEFEPGKPFFVKCEDNTHDLLFGAQEVPFLYVNFGKRQACQPPSNTIQLLSGRAMRLGFSLDKSQILTLHIVDMGPIDRQENDVRDGVETKRVLSSIEDIFGGIYTFLS